MKTYTAGEDIKPGDVLVIEADGTVRKAPTQSTGPLFSDNMNEAEKTAAVEGLGETSK